MAKQYTWQKAIEIILDRAPGAMHYKDIADQIIEEKLRAKVGATPAATVSSQLATRLGSDANQCPWQRVGRGQYISIKSTKSRSRKRKNRKPEPQESAEENNEDQYSVISSFGMYWRRESVQWNSNPKLFGMQSLEAESVDFSKQIGLYLLYDAREVIYVGRATERPLGRRLYEHTLDRLSSRWDRFSWFGLMPVSESGKLEEIRDTFSVTKLLPALEAIFIEALEPRQNRKRGDDLAAVEYIQKLDPAIEKKRIKLLMENVYSKL